MKQEEVKKSHPLLNLLRKEGVKKGVMEEGVDAGVKDQLVKKTLKNVEQKIAIEELPSLTSIDYWDSRCLSTVHYSCDHVTGGQMLPLDQRCNLWGN